MLSMCLGNFQKLQPWLPMLTVWIANHWIVPNLVMTYKKLWKMDMFHRNSGLPIENGDFP